jgi:1,4-alpha-glucan branching enzyme
MQLRHRQTSTIARPVAPKGTHKAQRPIETPVEFILNQPQAHTATVVGSFNDWDASRTPMHREPQGSWKATVWLPTGRYEYRFVVDGQWMSDPDAKEHVQNTFGSTNSVRVV